MTIIGNGQTLPHRGLRGRAPQDDPNPQESPPGMRSCPSQEEAVDRALHELRGSMRTVQAQRPHLPTGRAPLDITCPPRRRQGVGIPPFSTPPERSTSARRVLRGPAFGRASSLVGVSPRAASKSATCPPTRAVESPGSLSRLLRRYPGLPPPRGKRGPRRERLRTTSR